MGNRGRDDRPEAFDFFDPRSEVHEVSLVGECWHPVTPDDFVKLGLNFLRGLRINHCGDCEILSLGLRLEIYSRIANKMLPCVCVKKVRVVNLPRQRL
jgi:hypothetical protein